MIERERERRRVCVIERERLFSSRSTLNSYTNMFYYCTASGLAHMALSDLKGCVVGVHDRCGRTGGAGEGQPTVVGRQLEGSLGRHSVTRVEADGTRDGTEHGKVLEGHLAGAVLT